MSGIYIPGMEMPECGYVCLKVFTSGEVLMTKERRGALVITGIREKVGTAIPVPEHGDLIDRNKLYEKTAEGEAQALHMVEVTMHDEDTTEWRKWSTVLTERSAFKFDVADAPTILPAD